jgi:curli biogenesis system outer membrane secretion channel CsgG
MSRPLQRRKPDSNGDASARGHAPHTLPRDALIASSLLEADEFIPRDSDEHRSSERAGNDRSDLESSCRTSLPQLRTHMQIRLGETPSHLSSWLMTAATVTSLVTPMAAHAQPTVSVPDFKNNVTGAWWWQGPVAQDLSHALANELAATGDIKVVERRNLSQVLSEQELAELGIVRQSSPTAARKGQMTGARYIILGTVTSYDTSTNVESKGSGMSFLGFGGAKQNTVTQDYVAIDIRVVDSTTGEVVGSRTVEGRASNTMEQKPAAGRRTAGRLCADEQRWLCRDGSSRDAELLEQFHHGQSHAGSQGDSSRIDRSLGVCELSAGAQRGLHGQLQRQGCPASPEHTGDSEAGMTSLASGVPVNRRSTGSATAHTDCGPVAHRWEAPRALKGADQLA